MENDEGGREARGKEGKGKLHTRRVYL